MAVQLAILAVCVLCVGFCHGGIGDYEQFNRYMMYFEEKEIGKLYVKSDSLDRCFAHCDHDKECKLFQYDQSDEECTFFSVNKDDAPDWNWVQNDHVTAYQVKLDAVKPGPSQAPYSCIALDDEDNQDQTDGYIAYPGYQLDLPAPSPDEMDMSRMAIPDGNIGRCTYYCDQDPQCKLFNYDTSVKYCFFKSTTKAEFPDAWTQSNRMVAYEKPGSGAADSNNYYVYPNRGLRLVSPDPLALGWMVIPDDDAVGRCKEVCNRDERCKLFNYDRVKRRCSFKSAIQWQHRHAWKKGVEGVDAYQKKICQNENLIFKLNKVENKQFYLPNRHYPQFYNGFMRAIDGDVTHCIDRCYWDEDCKLFNFNKDTKWCYFKKWTSTSEVNNTNRWKDKDTVDVYTKESVSDLEPSIPDSISNPTPTTDPEINSCYEGGQEYTVHDSWWSCNDEPCFECHCTADGTIDRRYKKDENGQDICTADMLLHR